MTAMISKKLEWNRVKNNETLNKNSRHLWRTLKPSFFDGFLLYRAVKALHVQAIMTSRDKVVWLGLTVRLLIAQWCNIKKYSVFLLLNMHIIISSWQILYFQCLIIRFYRFPLILPKRKKITWAHTSCRWLSEISGHEPHTPATHDARSRRLFADTCSRSYWGLETCHVSICDQ